MKNKIKILIIDNYDSFTFNLFQYIGEIAECETVRNSVIVRRNDEITIEEIKKAKYDRIIISPGPGNPADIEYFGVCSRVLLEIGKTIPVLGVCLGMQGMAHYFGGRVIRAKTPMHGKTSEVINDGKDIFQGLPKKFKVMRYHSLVADRNSLPDCLEITAQTNDAENEIMGLRHKKFPIKGIQFHPESFATEYGKEILKNFLTR